MFDRISGHIGGFFTWIAAKPQHLRNFTHLWWATLGKSPQESMFIIGAWLNQQDGGRIPRVVPTGKLGAIPHTIFTNGTTPDRGATWGKVTATGAAPHPLGPTFLDDSRWPRELP